MVMDTKACGDAIHGVKKSQHDSATELNLRLRKISLNVKWTVNISKILKNFYPLFY